MRNKKTNSKPKMVYVKKGNQVYLEFQTLMPNKYSSQERARLRAFEKKVMKKDSREN